MQGKCKQAFRQACSSNRLNVPVNWWWNKFKDPGSSSKVKRKKQERKEGDEQVYDQVHTDERVYNQVHIGLNELPGSLNLFHHQCGRYQR